ncbi:MAG: NUDIX hydrolase [Gammaproteobacteria bacterium]|nr:NUDIX hydrolase [Gammaproteobacteria bacterium]
MNKPVTPLITVDTIIEIPNGPSTSIVLIERRYPPSGWALPGGFVDVGETLEQAAVREAREETNLDIQLKVLLGCYSSPARDKRGHMVSVIYVAEGAGIPKAQDDAKALDLFDLDALPQRLAFDHALILDDYRRYRSSGELTPLR